jgi:hypothetical protein
VHGIGIPGNRLVIPLKVRANLPKAKDFVVFFVVDSGAPFTSLSEKTIEKICGEKSSFNMIIQGLRKYMIWERTFLFDYSRIKKKSLLIRINRPNG